MKVPKTHHLLRRKAVWYYHRRVPLELVDAIGRKIVTKSLGTRSLDDAVRLREIEDVRWAAEFDALTQRGSKPEPAQTGPTERVDGRSLIQAYVARMDVRAEARLMADPPASNRERRQMVEDVETGLGMLLDIDDPRGDEHVALAVDQIEQDQGSHEIAVSDTLETFFAQIRRGLIELDRRKLARLRDDSWVGHIDEMFAPRAKPRISFEALCKQYLDEREEDGAANGTNQKSLDQRRSYIALLGEIVGKSTEVGAINYDACQRVRSTLAKVPANRTKIYPGLPLAEAIERGKSDGKPSLAALTQSQYLGTFAELLDLATKKQLIPTNYARGMTPVKRDDLADADRRLPFEPDQLVRFFTSDFYRACAASGPEPFLHDPTGWRFWLPLLALFTGMRPKEICQAEVGDVRQTGKGTWYFDVVASEEDESGAAPRKTLKTASSRRAIPIHDELLRIGFIRYVETKMGGSDPRLFAIKPDKYGNQATYALKRFRDSFLPAAIQLAPRQTFYSFRHTFRDALRRIEAGHDVLLGLGGWSPGSSVTSDHYGKKLGPDQLRASVNKVAFEGLDLSHLRTR